MEKTNKVCPLAFCSGEIRRCVDESCAWWADDRCAVVDIADAISSAADVIDDAIERNV